MKIHKSTLYILLSIIILSCSEYKPQNCKNFKTGKFSFHSENTGTDFLIDRQDTLHIQTEIQTRNTSEWKVDWINDCEYNISLLRDNYGLVKSFEGEDLPTFNYKIIKSTGDYYIFQGTHIPTQNKLSDTVWKIK